MGSSSSSLSETNYTNQPITQESVSNPLNVANSNARIGSSEVFAMGGSSLTFNTSVDQKTVDSAFDFGSKLVQVVADITRQNNASQAAASKDETKAAATGEKATAAEIDWTKYKTELMIGGGLLVWWFLGRKK